MSDDTNSMTHERMLGTKISKYVKLRELSKVITRRWYEMNCTRIVQTQYIRDQLLVPN